MPRALWITGPGQVELRGAALAPADGDVVIDALYSGISRGTEALVLRGGVPPSEHDRMRCPLQEGGFPFPVKYGYAAVGRVADGDPRLVGREIFVLHPHQDRFAAPATMAVPLPEDVPPHRAVLAANMETALNLVWDAGIAPGDRVVVVGAGTVGALAGWLAARIPGTDVTLADVNPTRAVLAEALGCHFAAPGALPDDADVAIHASATEAGLATALAAAGPEATVVEASWYGDRRVSLSLGGAFHSRRLRLVSSQVGRVPPARQPRWSNRRRLEAALALLAAPALEALVTGETPFDAIAGRYAAILADPGTLCHRISYG